MPTEMTPEQKPFAIGEEVKFVTCVSRGSSMSFATKTGTVTQYSKPLGKKVCIKVKRGKSWWVPVEEVVSMQEKSQLTRLVEALR